jgi:hypothetical protein
VDRFNERIVAFYARGMTTRDIRAQTAQATASQAT